jgi:hypothetical protein
VDWLDGYPKNGGLLKDHAGKDQTLSTVLVELSFELKPELSYSPSLVKMASQSFSRASAVCRSPVDGGGSFTAFLFLSHCSSLLQDSSLAPSLRITPFTKPAQPLC